MTLTAGQIIDAARYSHPSFDAGLVPNSVAARFVSEAQRHLYTAIHEKNPQALVRRWVIALLPGQNIAQVGAGTGYGGPAQRRPGLVGTGTDVGSLATLSEASVPLTPSRAVSVASDATLTDAGAAWGVDAWLGQLVQVTAGQGAGQVRQIASNTADTLTLTQAWTTVPDATSVFQVMTNVEAVTGTVGVQLGKHQPVRSVSSWLVMLDPSGQPYLDLAQPVQVPMTEAIPLPPHYYVDHGLVRFRKADSPQVDPDRQTILTLAPLEQQTAPPRSYSATVVNGQLQLLRPFDQWHHAVALEVPYLPLCPGVSGASDVLLLGDAAEEALVARVAMRMGERAVAMGRMQAAQYSALLGLAQTNAGAYLAMMTHGGRARVSSVTTVW